MKKHFAIILLSTTLLMTPQFTFSDAPKINKAPEVNSTMALNYDDAKSLFEDKKEK